MPIFIVVENEFLSLSGLSEVQRDMCLSIEHKRHFMHLPQPSNLYMLPSKFASHDGTVAKQKPKQTNTHFHWKITLFTVYFSNAHTIDTHWFRWATIYLIQMTIN